MRKSQVEETVELVGSSRPYHSKAQVIDGEFTVLPSAAACNAARAAAKTAEEREAIFFCNKFWDPDTGRRIRAPKM